MNERGLWSPLEAVNDNLKMKRQDLFRGYNIYGGHIYAQNAIPGIVGSSNRAVDPCLGCSEELH